ncbi:MAG: pantoate--beta-alanine ligase [Planctomycetota bacterium]
MIEILRDPSSAAAWCERTRAAGQSLGFVPTMGALHEGHLALVRAALERNDRVCVSVFVNPLQFNEKGDFECYPRDLEGDSRALAATGCSMVFTGTLEQFFPADVALRDPGPRALGLEGDLRPGHFAGVATIVQRLFEVVKPDTAYFGQKDFQQTLVVEDLARAMGYPRIRVCPTVREPSGLAMSSRNRLLSAEARERAVLLSRSLRAARAAWRSGQRGAAELAGAMRAEFDRRPQDGVPVVIEYATVRDPSAWTPNEPSGPLERAVALVAARVASVRLIDNMVLHEG